MHIIFYGYVGQYLLNKIPGGHAYLWGHCVKILITIDWQTTLEEGLKSHTHTLPMILESMGKKQSILRAIAPILRKNEK